MLKKSRLQDSSRLGRLVVAKGWINDEQLEQALSYQQNNDCKFGESLVQLGFINHKQLKKVLSKQRWVRSLVAGAVMVSSPICPVLASESNDGNRFFIEADQSNLQDDNFQAMNSSPVASAKTGYQLGIRHRFSARSMVEFSMGRAETPQQYGHASSLPLSQKRLLNVSPDNAAHSVNAAISLKKQIRSDRYKNTIPAIYRLTLKGYSIYEAKGNKIHYWNLNRVKNKSIKKYEVMFSVTKHF